MLVLIALAAALVLLLDRNHRAGQRLAGTTDVIDRDWARTSADLAAVDPIPRHRKVSARTAATVRLATGPR